MNMEKQNWTNIWDDSRVLLMLPLAVRKLELPAACAEALEQAQEKVIADRSVYESVKAAGVYMMERREEESVEQLRLAAGKTDLPFKTIAAVMLIMGIPMMERVYEEKQTPAELMWESLTDLRCKLQEEYDCSGIWGTTALGWYMRLYNLAIVKLGRLEFEPFGYKWDTPCWGVQKDDPVINTHIPSTGPLLLDEALDSFRRAYRFFGYTKPMPVVIASWMMYPPICEEVFKPNSNMKKFYDLFHVVEQYEDPDNKNFWRVYNMRYYQGILDKVPVDTSLRRGIRDFMMSGRHMGIGRCMLLFDGENVISK